MAGAIPFDPTANVAPSGPAGAFLNAKADPGDMGAGIGEALQSFSKRVDEAQVNDTYSKDFSPKFRDLYQKYYALQGKDAVDKMPEFQAQMEDVRAQARGSLANADQRMAFDNISRRRVEAELDGMARYADQQNKVWEHGAHVGMLDTLSQGAADKGNDEIEFGKALGSGQFEIDRYGTAHGQSAEQMRMEYSQWASKAAAQRLQSWSLTDPVAAQAWYKDPKNHSMIEPAARPVIEHMLKQSVQPVEARTDADQVLRAATATVNLTGKGAQVNDDGSPPMLGFVGDPQVIANSISAALAKGDISPEDAAFNMEQLKRQMQAPGGVEVTQRSKTEVQARIGQMMADARALAEKRHPGDPVYADQVAAQVKTHLSNIVAAQDGQARQAHSDVTAAVMGLGGGHPITDMSQLYASPAAAEAMRSMTPESQRGIISLVEHNAKAARGEFQRSDPALVNDLRNRIFLPDSDPNKLRSPADLAPFYSKGLNYTDGEHLLKNMQEANSPEGSAFARQVNDVKNTGTKMLTSDMMMKAFPAQADEAAYRFRQYVDGQITAARAAGTDPHSLFVPGTKDYVLDPVKVKSFMQMPKAAIAAKAGEVRAAEKPAMATWKDFDNLQSGDQFTDPQGNVRKKP